MDHHALRRLRHAQGWSQADLAARVGVSAGYILKLERGQVDEVSPLLERGLAHELGVEVGLIAPVDERAREALGPDDGVLRPRRRVARSATDRSG